MKNPFKRPLRMGDREQIRAVKIMNGDELYCPVCYKTYDPDRHSVGEGCCRTGKSRGLLQAGAAVKTAEAANAH